MNHKQPPKDGIEGLKKHWRQDLSAGFILFLLALPLSVGIAIASGMPATAGVLAAIVGGLVGSLIGGSYVTINGPAAGMIVIVVAAVGDLGAGDPTAGYHLTLAAILFAGALQVAMGVARMGGLGLAFPTSVIHGMMMAIGVIIFAKQSHIALGVTPASKTIFALLAEIPTSIANMNPEIALIGIGSIAIVIAQSQVKSGWLKKIPGPLIAVVFGVVLGHVFDIEHEHTVRMFMKTATIGPKFLLSVPDHIRDAIAYPDFSMIGRSMFWRAVITISLVATIESILSAYAVDKLDPYRRTSNLNRELWSKGVCNMFCGSIGGLPIIAEIVRSSANVSNGAKTRWSNFFHGVFLLLFVAMFPALLHSIPLASLAGILVVVGYRLGSPKQLAHAGKIGWDQLVVMFSTLVLVLQTDLLVGVAGGFVIEIALNLVRSRSPLGLFVARWSTQTNGGKTEFLIRGPLVSTNFVQLRSKLIEASEGKSVIVNMSKSTFVDHTVMEHLERLHEAGEATGHPVELSFSHKHVSVSKHKLAGRRLAR